MKNIFFILAFLCGALNFSLAQTNDDIQTITQAENMTKQVIKVKGATCKKDLGMIVANVQKLAGVSACEVLKHGAVTTLEVSFDDNKTDLSAIKKAVLNTGTCHNPEERRYQVKI